MIHIVAFDLICNMQIIDWHVLVPVYVRHIKMIMSLQKYVLKCLFHHLNVFFVHVSVMSAFSCLTFSQDILLISSTFKFYILFHIVFHLYYSFLYIHLGFHIQFHMVEFFTSFFTRLTFLVLSVSHIFSHGHFTWYFTFLWNNVWNTIWKPCETHVKFRMVSTWNSHAFHRVAPSSEWGRHYHDEKQMGSKIRFQN